MFVVMQGKKAKTFQTYQIQGENDVCSAGNNKLLLYIVCVVKRSFKRVSRPLALLKGEFLYAYVYDRLRFH